MMPKGSLLFSALMAVSSLSMVCFAQSDILLGAKKAIPFHVSAELRQQIAGLLEDLYDFSEASGGGCIRTTVSHQAASQLMGMGKPVVPPLLVMVNESESRVRQAVVWTLGYLDDPRTIEPLIAALKDEYAGVRHYAAAALGQKNNKRAVAPLIQALKDSHSLTRLSAADSLGRLKDPRAIEALSNLLSDESKEVRYKAVWALGQIKDEQAATVLLGLLSNDDIYVRRKSIEGLGNIGDLRAVEPLIELLKSRDEWTRQLAAEALGKIKDLRATEPLMLTLKNDTLPKIRSQAAIALGGIKDERAAHTLTYSSQHDQDGTVRYEAIKALGVLEGVSSEPFIRALKDENSWVRKHAAEILGELGDQSAIKPLKALLRDEDVGISMEAHTALSKLMDGEEYGKLRREEWLEQAAKEIQDLERSIESLDPAGCDRAHKKLLEDKRSHAHSLHYYGRDYYFEAKDYLKAKEVFERALEYDPDNPEAYYYLGRIEKAEGRPAESIGLFKQALNKSEVRHKEGSIPKDRYEWIQVRATKSLILAHKKLKDFTAAHRVAEAAIKRFEAWLKDNPANKFLEGNINKFREMLSSL